MPPKGKKLVPAKASSKRKREVEEVEDSPEESSTASNSGDESSNSDTSSDSEESEDDEDDEGSENGSGSDEEEDDSDQESESEIEPVTKKSRGASAGKPTAKKTAKAKPKTKTSKTTKKSSGKKSSKQKGKKSSKESSTDSTKVPKIKSLKKSDRLEEARKAYKWWEAETHPNGINWKYLEHPGICFPPEYAPHNIPLLYDGKEVALTPSQEEIASFFAAMPLDGPQLGNPKTKIVFEKNFFEDFKEELGPGHVIKSFAKCDFSRIRDYLQLQKDIKKAATDEEKLKKKDEKEVQTLRYGYALIDGRVEKVRNIVLSRWSD